MTSYASGSPGSAAVAAGSPQAAEAAADVLRAGGNAVDAAVAAGFVCGLSEPGLASLGGGGFLLSRRPDGRAEVFDFISTLPGLEPVPGAQHVELITVHYPSTTQVFEVGVGTIAVPGCVNGFIDAHRAEGRLPIEDVLAPAIRLARDGFPMDPGQAAIVRLVGEILTLTPASANVYAPGGQLIDGGETMVNVEYADVLGRIASGEITSLASPALAEPLVKLCRAQGGMVSEADVLSYATELREPMRVEHRGGRLLTNPSPSFGGGILAAALADLPDNPTRLQMVQHVERATQERKRIGVEAIRGTTHISVVDADGAVASMTISAGTCSGVMLPGTGIQLNNFLGEADLHPGGRERWIPGQRVSSMMAPSVLELNDGRMIALGSGGSARIRTALLTVIVELTDRQQSLLGAVGASRVHRDEDGIAQIEAGLDAAEVAGLAAAFEINEWDVQDFFFGGVNAVIRHPDGTVEAVADHRRHGSALIVDLN